MAFRTNKGVISHRHQILALALLQCLFVCNFSGRVGAANYHVDLKTELHRSMARYRQLLEVGNSEGDRIQVDKKKSQENGEGEIRSMHAGQLETEKLENDGVLQSKTFESPTEDSTESQHINQGQQQEDLKLEREHESKKVNQLHSLQKYSNGNSGIAPQQEKNFSQVAAHENKREEQDGEQARKELKEGNTTEEPFVFPEPYLVGLTIKDWDEQRGSWLEENPHMKSTANKPRVLIVTGSQPEPCASPVGDHYQIKSLKLKLDYARMHNYEIFHNFAWLDPQFGNWWVKLPILRTLMLSHPEIEWFFWVDSDAVFTDMLFEAPFHTYEGYNMVMWGWEYGLYTTRSWVAFNAGVFLLRNCQWSLDLIDKWSPMGPKGPVRDEYGKIFTEFLSNRRSNFSSDDQSALAYLLIKDEGLRSKVKLVDSESYAMSGFWIEVVETYENCFEKYHPGLGDKRWPWITHFTGCGFCAGFDNPEYAYDRCLATFDRAYNFADNQVLAYMGFQHKNMSSEVLIRTRNDTDQPLELLGVNPWKDRIAKVAAEAEAAT